MTNVFISYSRKDSVFARRLFDALTAQERSTWADWEGIPYSVDFWREIQQGIDAAEVFLCIISPDSLMSMVCNQEVAHARSNNKRIVPILHRTIDERVMAGEWFGKEWENTARENWTELKKLNWLFFRNEDDFDKSFASLIETIDHDPELVRFHTRMLVKAREWEAVRDRDLGQLLRGEELLAAEAWLKFNADKPPKPTDLHIAYIQESIAQREREAANEVRQQQRLRLLAIVLSILLMFSLIAAGIAVNRTQVADQNANVALSNFNLASTNESLANRQAVESRSLALAANAQVVGETDTQLALALAVEANTISNPPPLAQASLSRFAYRGGQLMHMLAPDPDNPKDVVRATAFSLDGTLLAVGTTEGRITLWDMKVFKQIATLPKLDASINVIQFSPDGMRLAVGYGTSGSLVVVKLEDESALTLRGHTSEVSSINFTPDGKRLVTTESNGFVYSWDAISGEVLWNVINEENNVFSDENNVFRVSQVVGVLSPDGTTYYATAAFTYTIFVLDTLKGKEIRRLTLGLENHNTNVGSGCAQLAIHPDGKRLLCVGAEFDKPRLLLVDVQTGITKIDYPVNVSVLTKPTFSADGSRFVTGDFTAVMLWETEGGKLLHTYNINTRPSFTAFSPDGLKVICDLPDGVAVLDASLRNGAIDAELPVSDWFSLDKERDALWIVSENALRVRLIDATDGGILIDFAPGKSTLEIIGGLAALPDGGVLVYVSNVVNSTNYLARWDAGNLYDGGSPTWRTDLGGASIYVLSVSADGAHAVTSFFDDSSPAVWDLSTGMITRRLDVIPFGGGAVTFTPDGSKIGTMSCYAKEQDGPCTDSRFDVWNVATGDLIYTLNHLSGGIAVSPDSQLWALSNTGGVIVLANVQTGAIIRRFYGHAGNVYAMAFNANASRLVSGGFSGDRTILLWDVATGEVLRQIDLGSTVWRLEFASSGDRFFSLDQSMLTQSRRFINRWRVDDSIESLLAWTDANRQWRPFTCAERARYTILPLCDELLDTNTAVTVMSSRTPFPTVVMQPTRTPYPRTSTPTPTAVPTATSTPTPAPYAYRALRGVSWSPDGQRLLASEESGFVVVWDVATHRELYRLEGHDSDAAVMGPRGLWSPDGTLIATYSAHNNALIWDAATGKLLYTLSGHNDHISDISWSKDSKRLVTASLDGTARVWDVITGKQISRLKGHSAAIQDVAFAPDGANVATASDDGTARVWNAATGNQVWNFGDRDAIPALSLAGKSIAVTSVIWSHDGALLIATGNDGAAIVWDAVTGKRLGTLRVPGERGLFNTFSYAIYAVSLSTNDTRLTLNTLGTPPTVWDMQTQKQLFTLVGHTDLVTPVRWSPNGSRLLTASYDGTIRIWDATNGKQTLMMDHRASVYAADWSPDGTRIASVADNGTVRLWDAVTGIELPFLAVPAVQVTAQVTNVLADAQATSAVVQQTMAGLLPTFGVELTKDALRATATAVNFIPAPTQLRIQPNADGILFKDDFSNNDGVMWETDRGTEGVFSNVEDGKYVIDLTNNKSWFVGAGFNAPEKAPIFNTPFEMQFELDQITTNQDVTGVTVVFNVTANYLSFTGIDVYEDGRVLLLKDFQLVDQPKGQPFKFYRDRPNIVRLRVTGTANQMYINNILIVEIPSTDPVYGTIGFGFGNNFQKGDYHAEFDNLIVSPLVKATSTPFLESDFTASPAP